MTIHSTSLTAAQPIVSVKDGKVFANSRDVAEFFGKEHKNVLRDIANLLCEAPGIELNFEPIELEVKVGFGFRKVRGYDMTRDGFTLLAMGFTGKKALQFKLQYIEAFNRMEAKFKTAQPVPADNHGLLMELVSQQTETNRLLRALVEGNQSVTSAVQAVQQALPKPKDERMLSAREAQN
ncbi:Rha family transcriptional regulator [Brucella pseudogrignonensis]|uniref:Rha family transcriptional regulator n=1 Tax=Brucella pseudogrignonensis TaxID=419475 RepID=UPI003BA1DBA5